ncbi:MAG: hypothetical protein Q4E09_01075 [Eubacteriales bacterium]|nr:hypothetical protein [Eubacteriales bacterium]
MPSIIHVFVTPSLVDEVIQVAEDNGSSGATIFKTRSSSHQKQETFWNVELEEQIALILIVTPQDKVKSLILALEQKFDFANTGIGQLLVTPAYSVKGL